MEPSFSLLAAIAAALPSARGSREDRLAAAVKELAALRPYAERVIRGEPVRILGSQVGRRTPAVCHESGAVSGFRGDRLKPADIWEDDICLAPGDKVRYLSYQDGTAAVVRADGRRHEAIVPAGLRECQAYWLAAALRAAEANPPVRNGFKVRPQAGRRLLEQRAAE